MESGDSRSGEAVQRSHCIVEDRGFRISSCCPFCSSPHPHLSASHSPSALSLTASAVLSLPLHCFRSSLSFSSNVVEVSTSLSAVYCITASPSLLVCSATVSSRSRIFVGALLGSSHQSSAAQVVNRSAMSDVKDGAEDELVDYEEDAAQLEPTEKGKKGTAAGGDAKKGSYAGIHSSGFRDFLLKSELLLAVTDCGFEHPSEGTPTSQPLAIQPTRSSAAVTG